MHEKLYPGENTLFLFSRAAKVIENEFYTKDKKK